jgi:hypothetical protein
MFDFLKSPRRREKEREKARRQALYREGEQVAEAIAGAIDAYLVPRIAQLQDSLLDVFAQRLLTIKDRPEHSPQLIARAEFIVFLESIETLEDRLQKETAGAVADWHDVAKKTDIVPVFEHYVRSKAQSAKLEMVVRAIDMAGDAVIAADPGAPRPTFSDDLPNDLVPR